MDGSHSFTFKKSLGQNFLQDKNIVSNIVKKTEILPDSLIVEIGPGDGALTRELVATNNQVISFEIDKTLKPALDKLVYDNLEIVYADFMKVDLNKYIKKYSYNKLYVIANLPYYITTAIITKIISNYNVDYMSLMMQKEVGDRLKSSAGSRDYNSLSIFVQYYFKLEKIMDVSRNCFYPRPNVDSVVLKFTKRAYPVIALNEQKFFLLVQDAFRQKRKNLRNNLKNYDLAKIGDILKKFGKDITYRAEQLTIEEFIVLSNELFAK